MHCMKGLVIVELNDRKGIRLFFFLGIYQITKSGLSNEFSKLDDFKILVNHVLSLENRLVNVLPWRVCGKVSCHYIAN